MRQTRPLVYAAHPMTTYGSTLEHSRLRAIRDLLPGAEIINPAERYDTGAQWLEDWPVLVRRLHGLVVFGDTQSSIGAGCLREMADAWAMCVPVAMIDSSLKPCRVSKLSIEIGLLPSPSRTAVLAGGESVELSKHFRLPAPTLHLVQPEKRRQHD